jgi:hypothetical protein
MSYGTKHLGYIESLGRDLNLICLMPFLDQCGHKSAEPNNSSYISVDLHWDKGAVNLAIDKSFSNLEEYNYSYSANAGNTKLLFTYGFYTENNPFSEVQLIIKFKKANFDVEKYNICTQVLCYGINLEAFYKGEYEEVDMAYSLLNNGGINNDLLNAFRLYVYPNDKFFEERHFIADKLKKGKMISYENEIKALLLYKDFIKLHLANMKFGMVINLSFRLMRFILSKIPGIILKLIGIK